jgi:hypothetical protein
VPHAGLELAVCDIWPVQEPLSGILPGLKGSDIRK